MDHLPRLSRPVCAVPPVPFIEVAGLVYRGPITTFSDQSHKIKPDGSDTSHVQYSCFVQQWLYFGVLIEFFGIWDIVVTQSDFTMDQNGCKEITNQLLADYLVACTAIEFNHNQALLRDKRPRRVYTNYTKAQYAKASSRMDEGLELFQKVDSFLHHDVVREAVDPAIWDSVIMLMGTLTRFWQVLNSSSRPETATLLTPDFSKYHFRSITDMRLNKQFCPHEQKLVLNLMENRPNDIAFFSLLGPNEDGKSHDKCNENRCEAYQVKKGEPYHTVHTSDCNGECTFVGLDSDYWASKLKTETVEEPQQGRFAQMLYDNVIPESFSKFATAVTFEDNKLLTHDVRLLKSKWLNGTLEDATMVAFSHVWADGLGNPGSNSLPTCQLERLQELANSAYKKSKRNVPFWFDTLLIPVRRKGLTDGEAVLQDRLKTNALRDMEWVYKYASKVLVLDQRLFEVDSTIMAPEEIGARIMCCVWSRRLWTLQEGCGKNKTVFRFRHEWVHWPDLHEQVLRRGGLSNWRSKGSKLPKKHPIVKAKLHDIKFVIQKEGDKFDTFDGFAAEGTVSPIVEAKSGGDKRLYKVTSQNWHSIHRFLEELTIDWTGSARAAALPRCIRGMYYRNCSRKEDEALVLASMIAETPGLAAKLTQECKDAGRRYVYLLKQLKEVPEDFLFLDQLRYDKDGERWIPQSLLGASAADYLPPPRRDVLPSRHGMHWIRAVRRRLSTLCPQTDDGIEVGLPGLRILSSGDHGIMKAPFKFKCWDSGFEVSLKHPGEPLKRSGGDDDDDGNNTVEEESLSDPSKLAGQPIHSIPTSEDQQYALILERAASTTTSSISTKTNTITTIDWTSVHAVLVSVTEWFPSDSRTSLSAGGKGIFRALATVTKLEDYEYEQQREDLPVVEVEEPATRLSGWLRPLEASGRKGAIQRWVVG